MDGRRQDGTADDMRERIGDMPPGKATAPGVTAKDDRNFVEGIPVRMRAGSPWRDLPERFGKRTAFPSGSADG